MPRTTILFAAATLAALPLLLSPAAGLAQNSALFQGPIVDPAAPEEQAPVATPAPASLKAPADDRLAFNRPEQWIIPQYFARIREIQKRAARQKRYERALPAGLTHKPARGETLPMQTLAALHRLPGPLQRNLPPARPNTDRVIVGQDVLMVRIDNGQVLDILPNVVH